MKSNKKQNNNNIQCFNSQNQLRTTFMENLRQEIIRQRLLSTGQAIPRYSS